MAASFFYGLPEQKIERIELKNVEVSFAEEANKGAPAMLSGIEECSKKGFLINNVETLILDQVSISGQVGKAFDVTNVDHYDVK